MLRNHERLGSRGLALLLASFVLASSAPLAAAPPEPDDALASPIELDSRPETDRAIEERLRAIYAELDRLGGIEVSAEAGVVHLRGTVLSLDAASEAETIAGRVEGVAAVANEIEQEAGVERRLEPIFAALRTRASEWLAYAPLVLLAATVVGLAWLLAHLLGRWSRKRSESSTFVRNLIGQVFRAGIVGLGIALALELLGATALLGALLGTAGVIGIALGFAFKDTGENYIASVLLSIRQPFDPRDYVKIGDVEGTVVRLTSRATVLLTVDGNHVRVPNSVVFRATIVNYTRNPERRFSFEVGVAVEADLREVQELAVATLLQVPGVLAKPPPACLVEEFGSSAMTLSVAGWIDQRNADWFKVRSEAKRMIKSAFEQANIDVPEPIFRVRTTTYDGGEATPTKPEAVAPDPELDVSPDEHLVRQIDQERATLANDDLLREDGRPE